MVKQFVAKKSLINAPIQQDARETEGEQLTYLGLPTTARKAQKVSISSASSDAGESDKKGGSALPLLVAAAAVVFLMAKK